SAELLGYDPQDVGGTSGKGAFARALVERCAAEDGLEALADAIVLTGRDRGAGNLAPKLAGEALDLPPGSEVGRFKIIEKLGAGGLGVVYLAEKGQGDNGARQQVALKVYRAVHARDRGAVRRL